MRSTCEGARSSRDFISISRFEGTPPGFSSTASLPPLKAKVTSPQILSRSIRQEHDGKLIDEKVHQYADQCMMKIVALKNNVEITLKCLSIQGKQVMENRG